MGHSAGPDDGAVLSEVDVPVDVALAADIGQAVPVRFWGTVLSCGACLILSVHHKLDALLSPTLEERQ